AYHGIPLPSSGGLSIDSLSLLSVVCSVSTNTPQPPNFTQDATVMTSAPVTNTTVCTDSVTTTARNPPIMVYTATKIAMIDTLTYISTPNKDSITIPPANSEKAMCKTTADTNEMMVSQSRQSLL